MYVINTIPHGKCFVRYLRTRCFCIRNLTRSLRSLVRFLIRQQLVRKYRTPALSMKYSLYTCYAGIITYCINILGSLYGDYHELLASRRQERHGIPGLFVLAFKWRPGCFTMLGCFCQHRCRQWSFHLFILGCRQTILVVSWTQLLWLVNLNILQISFRP